MAPGSLLVFPSQEYQVPKNAGHVGIIPDTEPQASCPREQLEPQLCLETGRAQLLAWHGPARHGTAAPAPGPVVLLPGVPTPLPGAILAPALQPSCSSPALWTRAQGLRPRRGSHSRGNPPNHHLLGQGRALTCEDAELVQTPVSFGASPAASPGWCRATDLIPRRRAPSSDTSWTPNRWIPPQNPAPNHRAGSWSSPGRTHRAGR